MARPCLLLDPPRTTRGLARMVLVATLGVSSQVLPVPVRAVQAMRPTSGPDGGPVRSLARAPDGDLFALSQGIYRSGDGGISWNPVAAVGATSLATSSGGPVFAFGSGSLYRSDSDGRFWNRLQNAPSGMLCLLFTPNGLGFTGTTHGVYKTLNEGETWQRVDLSPQSMHALATDETHRIFAAGEQDIWVSSDAGTHWSHFANVARRLTAMAVRPEGGLYVGLSLQEGAETPAGIYLVTQESPATLVGLEGLEVTDLVVRAGQVFAASSGGDVVPLRRGPGIYLGEAGGATWKSVVFGSVVSDLLLLPGGILLAATSPFCEDSGCLPGHGILRSDATGTVWKPSHRGVRHAVVYGLAATGSGRVYAAAERSIFWTDDRGSSWIPTLRTPSLEPRARSVAFELAVDLDGGLYALTPGESLFVSQDSGNTWTTVKASPQLERLAVSGSGVLIASREQNLWRSTTRGEDWSLVASFGDTSEAVVDLAISTGHLFAASSHRSFLSEDDGLTWSPVADLGGNLAADAPGGTLYVGDGENVWRLQQEKSWAPEPLPGIEGVTDLAVDAGGVVYAATASRSWMWRDGATEWIDLGGLESATGSYLGQHGPTFESRLLLDAAGYLYMGTASDGVYRSEASTPVALRGLRAARTADGARLCWELDSWGEMSAMHVLRSSDADGPYERRTLQPLQPAAFMCYIDVEVPPGPMWYRVAWRSADGSPRTTQAVLLEADEARPAVVARLTGVHVSNGGDVHIGYLLAAPGVVIRLSLYDSRGRLIRMLRQGLEAGGGHEVVWDRNDASGRAVGRGLYVVRLAAAGSVESRKVLLWRR